MLRKIIQGFLVLIVVSGAVNCDLVNAQLEGLNKSDAGVREEPLPGKPVIGKKNEVLVLKEKILEVQNNSQLGFAKVVPCKSVEGYGIYSPLEPNHPGSKIVFYVEPLNYGVMMSEGRFIIDCTVDLFILDQSGKLLAKNEKIRKLNMVSRSPVLDLYFTLELNIAKSVKQRSFVVKIILNDRIKNKSASTSQMVQLDITPKKAGENI